MPVGAADGLDILFSHSVFLSLGAGRLYSGTSCSVEFHC
jgi:hypothetical protein